MSSVTTVSICCTFTGKQQFNSLKSVSVQTLSCTYVTDLKLQTSLNVLSSDWLPHPTGRTAARTIPLPLSNADPGVV